MKKILTLLGFGMSLLMAANSINNIQSLKQLQKELEIIKKNALDNSLKENSVEKIRKKTSELQAKKRLFFTLNEYEKQKYKSSVTALKETIKKVIQDLRLYKNNIDNRYYIPVENVVCLNGQKSAYVPLSDYNKAISYLENNLDKRKKINLLIDSLELLLKKDSAFIYANDKMIDSVYNRLNSLLQNALNNYGRSGMQANVVTTNVQYIKVNTKTKINNGIKVKKITENYVEVGF